MHIVIPRNSHIPIEKTETYWTSADNQTRIGWSIYEGERALVADNHLLLKYIIDGIQPKPASTEGV